MYQKIFVQIDGSEPSSLALDAAIELGRLTRAQLRLFHAVVQASAWPADLIVLGSHGRRGVNRLFMGSDAEVMPRVAPAPVLLRANTGAARAAGAVGV